MAQRPGDTAERQMTAHVAAEVVVQRLPLLDATSVSEQRRHGACLPVTADHELHPVGVVEELADDG